MTNDSAPLWSEERIEEWLDDHWQGVGSAEALAAEMIDEYEAALLAAAQREEALRGELAEANASLQAIADFQGTMFGEATMTTGTQVADGWTEPDFVTVIKPLRSVPVVIVEKAKYDELTATIARLEAQVDAERDSNRIADANLTGDLTLAEDRIKQLRADNERLRAEMEEQAGWEDVPDGLYIENVLAIQSFADGFRDIGIKIDDSFSMDGEDWVNNYEWLADGIGRGMPPTWRIQALRAEGQG